MSSDIRGYNYSVKEHLNGAKGQMPFFYVTTSTLIIFKADYSIFTYSCNGTEMFNRIQCRYNIRSFYDFCPKINITLGTNNITIKVLHLDRSTKHYQYRRNYKEAEWKDYKLSK